MNCTNALFFGCGITPSVAGLPLGTLASCALLPSPFKAFNPEGLCDVIGAAC
ncbi:hypothetical protein [Symbiopectobacterium sp.]|uniref:hypothetical protein n=1 Tax=Symbiopectobacterium sp. TaxID=2952789 RepID=UPI003F35E1DC